MPVSELEMSTVRVGKTTSGESDGAGKDFISIVQSLASSSSLVDADFLQGLLYAGKEMED